MPLDDDQMIVVRSWVGDRVEADTLHERYDRLGTLDATVEEELRHQLAVLVDRPSQLSMPSGISVGTQENIRAMQARLDDFLGFGSLDDEEFESGPTIAKLVRSDYR